MTHAILTLLALCVGMPAGTGAQGRMDARRMAAQPLPDETLDKGTVSVLLRGGKVEGVEVLVLPATAGEGTESANQEILAGGKTNAEGRLYLKAAVHSGREVRVVVKPEGGPQWSVPFQIPLLGGVRLLFVTGGKGSPHGAGGEASPHGAGGEASPHGAGGEDMGEPGDTSDPHAGHAHGHGGSAGMARPTGPTTRDPAGLRLWMAFRVIAIEGGSLYMGVTYTLLNSGDKTFDPGDHGLLLPVPQGNKGVNLVHQGRGLKAVKHGILLSQHVPMGRHGLQFTANVKLPADRPTLNVRVGSALPLIGYSASLKAYPTVRIVGPSLEAPETVEASAEHGGKHLVYRSTPEGFPRTTLSFQVTGIPVRSRARSWPFALVALALALGGIALVVAHSRRSPRGAPARGVSARGASTQGASARGASAHGASARGASARGASPAPSDPHGRGPAGQEPPGRELTGRERTVQALVDLERDHLLGLLDDKAFDAERRRILNP